MTRTDGTREESIRALEVELEKLHARSFGWALSCCDADPEEAADVLQVAYLKVLDGRARFGGRALFSTWLFGVIRRTASERRRRRTVRRLLLSSNAAAIEPTTVAVEARLPVEIRRLQDALSRLPRRQREVVHLVFYDDLSIRESAEIMGVGLGSARVHYDRAKKKLRSLLQEGEAPGEQREGETR